MCISATDNSLSWAMHALLYVCTVVLIAGEDCW